MIERARFFQRDCLGRVLDLFDHALDDEDADAAVQPVEFDFDVVLGVGHLLVDGLQRVFDGLHHRVTRDATLGGDLRDCHHKVALHGECHLPEMFTLVCARHASCRARRVHTRPARSANCEPASG